MFEYELRVAYKRLSSEHRKSGNTEAPYAGIEVALSLEIPLTAITLALGYMDDDLLCFPNGDNAKLLTPFELNDNIRENLERAIGYPLDVTEIKIKS